MGERGRERGGRGRGEGGGEGEEGERGRERERGGRGRGEGGEEGKGREEQCGSVTTHANMVMSSHCISRCLQKSQCAVILQTISKGRVHGGRGTKDMGVACRCVQGKELFHPL